MADENANKNANEEGDKTTQPPADNSDQTKKEESKTVPLGALHEEREKRKSAEDQLSNLRAEKEESERKQAEEQGKFEELYGSTKTDLATANTKIESLQSQVNDFNSSVDSSVEKALENVKDESDKDLIKTLLDGKSAGEKQSILPGLIEKFLTPKNVNASLNGGNPATSKQTLEEKQTAMSEASKKGDTLAMIRLQREIEQLQKA